MQKTGGFQSTAQLGYDSGQWDNVMYGVKFE